MSKRPLTIAAALLVISAQALAHHAFSAEFDDKKPVQLRGNVTKMEWINPHAWLHIDVKDANGKVTPWDIELGPPNALVKRGWSKTSVPVGKEVIVDGFQSKDGSNRANGRDVTLPDGRKLFAASSLDGGATNDETK
jgi:uncharacterized protein DUF6152